MATLFCWGKKSELIGAAAKSLQDFNRFPLTKRPSLESRKFALQFSDEGIEGTLKNTARKDIEDINYPIPDVYAYIQNRVNVSRNTVYEVLKQSGRCNELAVNPQLFLDKVVMAIRNALNELLINGIEYHKINGSFYEMSLFKAEEIETYLDNLLAVSVDKQDKTPFNYYPVDSDTEREFACACEAEENIQFFFKLPHGFKIPTPIGNYVPDWAIVLDKDTRLYFVTETKGSLDKQDRRVSENMKIAYAEKHFEQFHDVGYKLAVTVKDL